MTAAQQWLTELSVWWWPRFADHLWQTTLFAGVVFVGCLVLRRGAARRRYSFWLVASLKFLIPTFLFVFVFQQAGIELPSLRSETRENALVQQLAAPALTIVNEESQEIAAAPQNHGTVYFALSMIWLTGFAALVLGWAIRRWRFLRALRLAKPVSEGREWQALQRAQRSLGVPGEIALLILQLQIEPGVWGVRRPVIVLPLTMAGHLDDNELEAIMLHELVHIQRRDNLISILQLALCALFWFHPLVWFISRRLFDERELACDERVVEISQAPAAYASSILKVVRFCFGWRVAGVTGATSGSNLSRRIENIMSNNTKQSVERRSRLVMAGLLGTALIMIVAGLYSSPRRADAAGIQPSDSSLAVTSDDNGVTNTVVDLEANDHSKKSGRSKQAPPAPPAPAAPEAPVIGPPPAPAAPTRTSTATAPAAPAAPASPAAPSSPATAPTAPPAPPDKQKKPKGKISKGALIEAPPPVYPEEARKQKIQGLVTVAIVIGEDGNVISAKAKSGPEELRGAAETAAMKARFKPTTVDDKPAKVAGAVSYNFVSDKKTP